ncbi:uncharacterized protein An08g05270 [Aspergillus niger]|uniref:Contig An08c0130, genomic contig n=2 Tax=Aspergillus niger TaxID=5061 RepID=A2QR98_ASPNC|nr:uncharacterized protein An08g05270 [Aspergillus niger]CAK45499.1 unnamed protein product [Aspergillus niger]
MDGEPRDGDAENRMEEASRALRSNCLARLRQPGGRVCVAQTADLAALGK